MGLHNGSDSKSSPPSSGASISGTIEFQGVSELAHDVTVYVRVQDATRVDASAVTVAEKIIRAVSIVPGAPPLPFTVEGIPENPRARFVVRVHADVDGDGAVSRGDYITMQSFPVETSGNRVFSIIARRVP